MNLFARGAEIPGSPGVAMHCALGSNGSRRSQLDQLGDFLIQRPGMLCRRPEGVNGPEKIGMLNSEPPKRRGF